MKWLPSQDCFVYSVNETKDFVVTKRSYLKKIATLFDKLGLIMHYSIRSKVILQELWSEGYEWDEPVKTESAKKAEKWLCELSELNSIKVPRCLWPNKNISRKYFHVFCDASLQAYAVAYLVCEYKSDGVDHYTSVIAAAKSRVAPLKSVSIPRVNGSTHGSSFDFKNLHHA